MIETVSDFLSICILIVIILYGFYCLYLVSLKHHEAILKLMEKKYYMYYDNSLDEDDDSEVLGNDYDLPPFLRDKNF